jgi:hypothetical protein
MMAAEDLDSVMRKLNHEIGQIKKRTVTGLLGGGFVILAQAQRWVPVEYGKLRASGYARQAQRDPNAVEVGFSASYAIFVHENIEQKLKGMKRPSGLGRYWGPQGRPQFLTAAVKAKQAEVLRIIARDAKGR